MENTNTVDRRARRLARNEVTRQRNKQRAAKNATKTRRVMSTIVMNPVADDGEETEPTATVTYICGHVGTVVERCVQAYVKRYCDKCATEKLPKPSECLQRFMTEHGNANDFGPMLGPIGAVIYARQSYFGISGMLAWSGSEAMFQAIEGVEPSRMVVPYIERFTLAGL